MTDSVTVEFAGNSDFAVEVVNVAGQASNQLAFTVQPIS